VTLVRQGRASSSIRLLTLANIYEFTGSRSNFAEFADVFSQVLGRKITYVAVTPEQAEQGMKARGMPDWLITVSFDGFFVLHVYATIQ